jgi:hypothetical protein|tara:strand:- start:275 stop:640 length:366 start_codon:yes stop_codon:yes gene_type:complete
MSRPTKYTPKLLDKANHYLNSYTRLIPSNQDLCLHLDISETTLYRWAEEHEQFRDILGKVKLTQFTVAMDGGLGGDLNANLVKLLMGKHGLSEKSSVDQTSSDGSMTPKSKIELVAKEFDV